MTIRAFLTFSIFLIASCSLKHKEKASRNIASNSISCTRLTQIIDEQKDLSEKEREAFLKMMGKIFELIGSEIYGLPDELSLKMDKVFTKELREKIKLLDDKQLEELKNIILRSRQARISNLSISAHVKDIKDVEKMMIEINALFINQPMTRIAMWHELNHVIDGILKNSLKDKDLEISAFSSQYDYTRKVFSHQQLRELKIRFPTDLPPELLERLEKVEAISIDGEQVEIINDNVMKTLLDERYSADFANFILRSSLNKHFITSVEDALKLSKEDFIKKRLKPYQGKFLRERLLNTLYIAAPLAGFYALYLITNEE